MANDGKGIETQRSRQRFGGIWRIAVGLVLLIGLVVAVGPRDLLDVYRSLSLPWALATFTVMYAWLLLGGIQVWLILRRVASIPFLPFLEAYLTSWALSFFIPGQLGDATQVLLLRRHGVPVAQSGAVYVVDKAISLVWMTIVAAVGIGLYTTLQGAWLVTLPIAAVLGGVVAIWILRRTNPRPGGWFSRVRGQLDHMIEQIWQLRKLRSVLMLNILLTIVKWILVGCKYWLAFLAFGVIVEPVAAATVPVASSLVGYIPISVAGAGTVEWTAVAFFGRLGVTPETTVAVYLLFRGSLTLSAVAVLLVGNLWPKSEPDRGLVGR